MTKIAATARGFQLSPSIGRCLTLKPKTDAKKKKGKKMNQVLPVMMKKKKKGKKKKNQVEPEMKEKQGKKKKQVEPEIIKAGDYVNISDLLFTKKRDYLVKFNGDKVKAEHLAGKVIIIYFGSLTYNYIREQWATIDLIDLYTEIQAKNAFEVVWVPIIDNKTLQNDPEQVFKEKFANMPWPCIPYSDLPSGERLLRRFGQFIIDELPSPFIIDPTGKVLYCSAYSILLKYVLEAFPFSYERMQSLISEDEALDKQISLKTLLATPERDYLISNKGKQVPIGNLEDKVVALYLYKDGLTEKLTKKLKQVYKQLAKRRVDFEVVLVYLHSRASTFDCVSEDSFNKRFKNMPWLALPFKDPKCKKVARIFDYPYSLNGPDIPDPTLVIIGPHGKFVGIFGCDILMNYGIEAYPFTRERVLELETEKAKKLMLDPFLAPIVLRGQDGSKINVFKLMMEKRVLVIIETRNVIRSARFLATLKEKYLQKKSKDDEFEVIHICVRTEQSAYVCGEDFPWLLHHFHDTPCLARQILGHVFMYTLAEGTALVAFERGGILVAKAWRREFGAREDMDFPFAGDLEKEIWRDMNVVYNFNYYEDE